MPGQHRDGDDAVQGDLVGIAEGSLGAGAQHRQDRETGRRHILHMQYTPNMGHDEARAAKVGAGA